MIEKPEEQFKVFIIALSIVAAFVWGELLGDYFPYRFAKNEAIMGSLVDYSYVPEDEDFIDSEELTACTIDFDCTVIPKGCCDCRRGGEMISINKAYTEIYQDSLDCGDLYYNCQEVSTCYPRKASCDYGQCVIKKLASGEGLSRIDLNVSGEVDIGDYRILLYEFLECRQTECNSITADLNGDRTVSYHDHVIFMDYFIREIGY